MVCRPSASSWKSWARSPSTAVNPSGSTSLWMRRSGLSSTSRAGGGHGGAFLQPAPGPGVVDVEVQPDRRPSGSLLQDLRLVARQGRQLEGANQPFVVRCGVSHGDIFAPLFPVLRLSACQPRDIQDRCGNPRHIAMNRRRGLDWTMKMGVSSTAERGRDSGEDQTASHRAVARRRRRGVLAAGGAGTRGGCGRTSADLGIRPRRRGRRPGPGGVPGRLPQPRHLQGRRSPRRLAAGHRPAQDAHARAGGDAPPASARPDRSRACWRRSGSGCSSRRSWICPGASGRSRPWSAACRGCRPAAPA